MKYYIFIAFFFFIMVSCTTQEEQKDYPLQSYNTLEDYSRNILDEFLQDVTIAPDDMGNVLTGSTSIRSFTRKAEGLLYRNKEGDAERAARILEWVLSYQNSDQSSDEYGIFKTEPADEGWPDHNWREFVGCDLINIHAHEELRELLPQGLVEDIENALLMAARGAQKRDVTHYYSNISIMSALLMEYVGVTQNHEDLRDKGLEKTKDIYDLYKKSGNAFSEFNSPTYYGVNMVGLATMRKLGHADTIRQMGAAMEDGLWETTGDFYHPEMKNMVGPFFRSYGMDMMRYNAIIGLWVGLAFNDEDLAPWPGKDGGKYGEVSNVVPALVLGVKPPDGVLDKFRQFQQSRYMEYSIPSHYEGPDVKEVSARITQPWMMGGMTGHRRSWVQLFLGTIYWQQPDSRFPGWLLVPGTTTADVKVTKEAMNIYKGGIDEELVLIVHGYKLGKDAFQGDKWQLPGINLNVESNVGTPEVSTIEGESLEQYFPNADGISAGVKISYSVTEEALSEGGEQPLVTITPEKGEEL